MLREFNGVGKEIDKYLGQPRMGLTRPSRLRKRRYVKSTTCSTEIEFASNSALNIFSVDSTTSQGRTTTGVMGSSYESNFDSVRTSSMILF